MRVFQQDFPFMTCPFYPALDVIRGCCSDTFPAAFSEPSCPARVEECATLHSLANGSLRMFAYHMMLRPVVHRQALPFRVRMVCHCFRDRVLVIFSS